MSMMVSPYRFAGGGGVSYPYALTVVNGDAEAGSTTGWTQTTGTNFAASSTPPANTFTYDGTWFFILSTNSAYSEVKATPIDLPAPVLTDVDAGLLTFNRSFKYNTHDPADQDWARCRVEFWSSTGGTGTFLGQFTGNQLDANTTNTTTVGKGVPPGTRSVVICIWGARFNGTELSFYFDSVTSELATGSQRANIYADRGTDTSGWTVSTGTGQPVTNTTWSSWAWSGITPGSQLAYGIYKEVAVSSLSAAAQAAIAAGAATLNLERYQWQANGTDASRTFIECRDVSNGVVGTLQDYASNTASGSTVLPNVQRGLTLTIPTTTTKFRINHTFARNDGTVLDVALGFVDCWASW